MQSHINVQRALGVRKNNKKKKKTISTHSFFKWCDGGVLDVYVYHRVMYKVVFRTIGDRQHRAFAGHPLGFQFSSELGRA